jgi:hypothetical protein
VLRYASAAAVAVYVAVAAAASGVGSGASVRTLRQFAPASFGGVLLLPEGRMVVRKRQRTALRWVRGPPPLLLPNLSRAVVAASAAAAPLSLLLPEGGWPGAQHHSAPPCCSRRDGWSCASANSPPSGGFEGRPRCCCHGPAYALLRVALAGAPCVLGRVGGRIDRAQAPTHRPHAFEAALAYPPWRWLTLPISGHPPSRR